MQQASFNARFSNLGHPNGIWVVSAIHGQAAQLAAVHDKLYENFRPGDRLVYTGNYLGGDNARPIDTLNGILSFRRRLLARPGMRAEDFTYLRGMQEEMWRKILQLQFELNPRDAVEWMATHHPEMGHILKAYGSSFEAASHAARQGAMALTRWTTALKAQIASHAGHDMLFTTLRRAAFTELRLVNEADSTPCNLLFVHAGINPRLPLLSQGDHFWWASKNFNALAEPYAPFRAVIRGHDPDRNGIHVGRAAISLDGGCGRGGQLICARIETSGKIADMLAA